MNEFILLKPFLVNRLLQLLCFECRIVLNLQIQFLLPNSYNMTTLFS